MMLVLAAMGAVMPFFYGLHQRMLTMKKEAEAKRRQLASEMTPEGLVNAFVALGAERDEFERQSKVDREQLKQLYAVLRECRDHANAVLTEPVYASAGVAQGQLLALVQKVQKALGGDLRAPISDTASADFLQLVPALGPMMTAQEALLADWARSREEIQGFLSGKAFRKVRSGVVQRLLERTKTFVAQDGMREKSFRDLADLARRAIEGVQTLAGKIDAMNVVLRDARKPDDSGLPLNVSANADGIRAVLTMWRATSERFDRSLAREEQLQTQHVDLTTKIEELRRNLNDTGTEAATLRKLLAIYLARS